MAKARYYFLYVDNAGDVITESAGAGIDQQRRHASLDNASQGEYWKKFFNRQEDT
jgi:hypothetical protein